MSILETLNIFMYNEYLEIETDKLLTFLIHDIVRVEFQLIVVLILILLQIINMIGIIFLEEWEIVFGYKILQDIKNINFMEMDN